MRRLIMAVTAIVILAASPLPSFGFRSDEGIKEGPAGLVFSIGPEVGRLNGKTTYHITIPTVEGLLESELEWPIDSWVAGVNAGLEREDHWSINLRVLTNLTEDTGTMEDSDWFEGIKFVFSESDASAELFHTLVVDAAARYVFFRAPNVTVGVVAGFLYEEFNLTASNLVQYSPIGIPGFDAVVSGPVITYDVVYAVPYGGIGLQLKPTEALRIGINALFGAAYADDEDDHLLRFKLSKADTNGTAVMVQLRGEYGVTPRWSVTAAFEYLSISTEGAQDQVFYAGPDAGLGFAGIADDIDSEQLTVLAGMKFSF